MKTPLLLRALQRVEVSETGCWLVQGLALDRDGYIRFQEGGRTHLAHRLVYEAMVAEIPDGLQIDHLCHTNSWCVGGKTCEHRRCVNPSHMEPVTLVENARRQYGARKTHCHKGHEFTPENTYTGCSRRQCRACQRESVARYKARKQASVEGLVAS